MRKILLSLLILISFNIKSQNKISYISCDKDTIILPNNEVGLKIYLAWFDTSIDKRPKLFLSSEKYIEYLNNKQVINYPLKEEEVITTEYSNEEIWWLD
jgi:hypothetical protein